MFSGKTKHGVDIKNTFGLPEGKREATWVLVAHRAGAKLFERRRSNALFELLKEIEFPEGRLKGTETASDGPGRSLDRGVADDFARQLATEMESGRNSNAYSKLVIIAAPKFMGKLNGALSKSTDKTVVRRIEKNIEKLSSNALKGQLSELVDP